jgi:hypothetical protein
MNDSTHSHDDVLIDRLVDGELSADERQQLLAGLDAQPDGWRRCALAFLEAQTWRSEMRRIVPPVAAAGAGKDCIASPQSTTTAPHPPRGWTRYSGAWLAVAAALMVAFGLGRQLGVGERTDLHNVQVAEAQKSTATSSKAADERQAATGDAVTLVVNDHRGVAHRVQVPLVEGRRLGEEFTETPNWSSSPELARRLDEQGLGLTAVRRYAPLYFEQHNQRIPFIVPVDDAVVTPVNRPVY